MVGRTHRKDDEWISIGEATRIMGCSKSWVLMLLNSGRLEGRKLHSRAWAVSRKAAEADVARYKQEMVGRRRVGRPRAENVVPEPAGRGRRPGGGVGSPRGNNDMKIGYDDAGIVPASDLIAITTAAKLTGIHRSWLHALIARGDVMVIEIDGKPFVRRSQIKAMPKRKVGRPPKAKKPA